MSATSSNFSAAAMSTSAACCGVSKLLAPEAGAAVAAGAFFVADCCAMERTDAHRHAQATAPTIQRSLQRFPFPDVDFICAPMISLPQLGCLPAPPTATATEASATASGSHAGGAAAAAGPSARSVESPGASSKGVAISATAAG